MNTSYPIQHLVLLVPILALPIVCIGFGITIRARRVLVSGIGILCIYVLLILGYVIMVWPGQSKILARGTSPMGQEYCIVQTYKGWAEPYQVSFYIRDGSGMWRWNYLAHQDIAWHSAIVTFTNGMAQVSRDGRPYRDVPMPTNTVDLARIEPGYRDEYCPSNFSAEDVLLFHNKRFKDN